MPSATLNRLRSRIGSMGLPSVAWPVYGDDNAITLFYDREKAEAFAKEKEGRLAGTHPLPVKDHA